MQPSMESVLATAGPMADLCPQNSLPAPAGAALPEHGRARASAAPTKETKQP